MADSKSESWNYRVLLGQGTFVDIARQLVSARLVLPFLYMSLGAPIVLAGVLLPIVQVSSLVAQLVSAPMIHGAKLHKWFIALASITVAASFAIVSIAAGDAPRAWIAVIFLFVAVVLGVGQGINGLAYQVLLGRILPAQRRGVLLYTQTAFAGLVAMAIAWASQHVIEQSSLLREHLELIWAGVFVTLVAGGAIILIREPEVRHVSASAEGENRRKGPIAEIRENFGAAVKMAWFRRFLAARCLYQSIELAMPFYAIHAASLHADDPRGLRTFVIASSVGLVLGGLVWRYLSQVSIRAVMALGALAACAGGVLALAIDELPDLQSPFVHAAVFFLVSVGSQGISNARKVYIAGLATDDERPYCIAVSNVVAGGVGIVIAFAFGAFAHLQGVVWPVWLMIGLNLIAALYTVRLPLVRMTPEAARLSV